MQVRCPKCGKFLMDNERFCTDCGENLTDFYENQLNNYTRSGQYYDSNVYANTYKSNVSDQPDMPFKKWVITVLVTNLFGIISWVFLFIWGFGNGPEVRKKYCKAMLIVKAISIVISTVLTMIYIGFVSRIFSNFNGYGSDYRSYYDSYYNKYDDYKYGDYGQDASSTPPQEYTYFYR